MKKDVKELIRESEERGRQKGWYARAKLAEEREQTLINEHAKERNQWGNDKRHLIRNYETSINKLQEQHEKILDDVRGKISKKNKELSKKEIVINNKLQDVDKLLEKMKHIIPKGIFNLEKHLTVIKETGYYIGRLKEIENDWDAIEAASNKLKKEASKYAEYSDIMADNHQEELFQNELKQII